MTVYTHTARFDSARALTEDEMRKAAPSIFATAAHASRSERFQPIPTIEILRGLMAEGFMPVGAKQSGTRDAGKADCTLPNRITNAAFQTARARKIFLNKWSQDRRSPRGLSTNCPGVVPLPIHSSQPHAPVNPILSLGAKISNLKAKYQI